MSTTIPEDTFESKPPTIVTSVIIPLGTSSSYSSVILSEKSALSESIESHKPEVRKAYYLTKRKLFLGLQMTNYFNHAKIIWSQVL